MNIHQTLAFAQAYQLGERLFEAAGQPAVDKMIGSAQQHLDHLWAHSDNPRHCAEAEAHLAGLKAVGNPERGLAKASVPFPS